MLPEVLRTLTETVASGQWLPPQRRRPQRHRAAADQLRRVRPANLTRLGPRDSVMTTINELEASRRWTVPLARQTEGWVRYRHLTQARHRRHDRSRPHFEIARPLRPDDRLGETAFSASRWLE
jgi:hypothetical protein